MVDLLSAAQKAALRADGHKVEFFLSICQPATLFTGLVNDAAIEQGSVSIAYDAGTSSDTSAIKPGMTLEVTTAYGVEKITIISITASGSSPNLTGTITVDANNIAIGDDDVLTIYDNYEPVTIQPTFDPSTGISKKRSAVWSDQTTSPPPTAKAGPGYGMAGFLSSGSKVFNLAGAGVPTAEGATISTYLWESDVGSLGSSSSASTTLTVNAAGQGWLSLTVTDSNAKIHTTRRRVFVHDPDPDSADYPYTDFTMSGPQLSGGSAKVGITVNGVSDFDTFRDGTLCIIWKREYYGDSEEHISLITGAENVHFQGYILKDTIKVDWQHGQVSFELGSVYDVAKELSLQSLYLQAVATPAYWFQYAAKMTLDRMVHWVLYWHSTILDVSQIEYSGDTRYKKLFKWNEGSLANQIADVASKFQCSVGCDKAGTLYIEPDIQYLDSSARAAISVVSDLTSADRREDFQIIRRHRKAVVAINLTGFFYDGVNVDTITPFQSLAPTKVRHATGSGKQGLDGMVVNDQDQANLIAGRHHALLNSDITGIRIKFAGNYSIVDAYPQRWWTLTLDAADDPRGLGLSNARLLVKDVNFQPDPETGSQLVDATFQIEEPGPDGITIPYPGNPGCTPGHGGGTQKPPADEQQEDADNPPVGIYAASSVNGALLLDLIDGAAWATESADDVNNIAIDPFWTKRYQTYDVNKIQYWLPGDGSIKKRNGSTGAFDDKTPPSAPPNTWSQSPAPAANTCNYTQILPDPFLSIIPTTLDPGYNAFIYVIAEFEDGSNTWGGWIGRSTDDGDTYSWLPLYTGTLPAEVRPIWASIDATHIWVTVWEDDTTEKLTLLEIDRDLFTMTAETALGAGAYADVFTSGSKWAFPATADDYGSGPSATVPLYVAGRMVDPAGLSGTYHVIANTGSWAAVDLLDEGGAAETWGDDVCTGLIAGATDGANGRPLYAAREPSAAFNYTDPIEFATASTNAVINLALSGADDDRVCAVWQDADAGEIKAVMIDMELEAVGTEVTVASINTIPISKNCDVDKVFVAYVDVNDNDKVKGVVLSLLGMSITVNSAVELAAFGEQIVLDKLDDNKFIIGYDKTFGVGQGGVRVVTVSGTTPSAGSETLTAQDTAGFIEAAGFVSGTRALLTHRDGIDPNTVWIELFSISGTTVARLDDVSKSHSAGSQYTFHETLTVVNDNLLFYRYPNAWIVPIKIENDTITLGTEVSASIRGTVGHIGQTKAVAFEQTSGAVQAWTATYDPDTNTLTSDANTQTGPAATVINHYLTEFTPGIYVIGFINSGSRRVAFLKVNFVDFYFAHDKLQYRSRSTIRGINTGGMVRSGKYVALGSRFSDAVMAAAASEDDNFVSWTDISSGLDTAKPINALTIVPYSGSRDGAGSGSEPGGFSNAKC